MAIKVETLKKYWGYSDFRPLQAEIIQSALNKKDTLALMPTGGGKSICFQVPGMMEEGVSIVVTPLIALMKDQVKQLQNRGILAAAIYSGMHFNDLDRILDNFVLGEYKFLYVSPERLLTELMIERTKKMNVRFLVIDEAHCISKWGHDFRPSYLKIKEFKKYCPKATIIALTATATAHTKADIVKQLEMKNVNVLSMSFKRNNLAIKCIESGNKLRTLAEVLSDQKESAIVYVKSRKQAAEISQFLIKCGLSADYYHAGLSNEVRAQKQDAWINNETQIIVSTNAFGMGIDKADVRSVFHLHVPLNMEAYYQEIGRAGRDGSLSQVYLIFNRLDLDLLEQQLEQKYPPKDELTKVYQSLCNYYKLAMGSSPEESFDFDFFDFISTFGLSSIPSHHALKLLESQEIIELKDGFQTPSTIQIILSNSELYNYQVKNEALDAFAKTLLRIYGGELFIQPTIISETEIARAHHIPLNRVEQYLDRFHQLGILIYKRQNAKSGISFLGNRFDAEKLPLNHADLRAKKAQEAHSIQVMRDFVLSTKRCRMAQLQDFFGEENAKNCEICDNCIRLNEENLKKKELLALGKNIENKLPIMLSELENELKNELNLEKLIHLHIDSGLWLLKNGELIKA